MRDALDIVDTFRRFFRKYEVDIATGCWEWRASKRGGYGQLAMPRHDNTKFVAVAHRVAYELFVGEIPAGLHVDHLCRNPGCVNPAHLEPVTPGENIRRGVSLTGQNSRKTHCKHGHEFTPENTYLHKRGRSCKTCSRARDRRIKMPPGATCDRCGAPAHDRIFRDGRRRNIDPANVLSVCRRCHMEIDGRMDALREMNRARRGVCAGCVERTALRAAA